MLKTVVFDLDGVVYRGATGIPGVAAEISRLQGKLQVLFLTNNATKSRQDYVEYLKKFGITAEKNDIMTSSFGSAHYISEKYGRGKKVHVIGESGLRDELKEEAGAVFAEENAEIVVVGLDRHLTYGKIDAGVKNILAGAKFILANSDPTYPTEDGLSLGSGSIGAALSYACGKPPDVIIGKPSLYLIEKLLQMRGAKAGEAAFVGDRLDIDMRMANEVGMKSVLVLTGVATEGDVKHAPAADQPAIVIKSAAEAGRALGI
ncbi:Haloacid dehalogenase-like hydrolase [uncultured archaeon]|nr:Haloacid dehalogenase-like hydrolase [uncultured archaeon]